jgi:hypothetical protein
MTFDGLCRAQKVTADERVELAFHLAFLRMKATLRHLMRGHLWTS